MSMEQYEAKRQFVARELSRCIAAAYGGVARLEYEYHEDDEETVIIRFDNGYHKTVSVSGDSRSGIMTDVMIALSGV